MEDNKTFYDLLCEGVEIGELVDAIDNGKVRIFDKFGRDNQVLSNDDKAELLSKLEYHQKMIWDKALPAKMRTEKCFYYWHNWPFLKDCGGELPHILDRAWIIGESKKQTKPTSKPLTSEAATNMANKRHAPANAEKERVRALAIPFIERGVLLHNQIAKEIEKSHCLAIKYDLILEATKEKCRHMGREDLIKGLIKSK